MSWYKAGTLGEGGGGGGGPEIWGVEWNGSSTTSWTRTETNAGYTNPVPVVNYSSGYSDFDYFSPWKDIQVVEDSTAGTLVEIPKFYYKLTQVANGGMKIQICMQQLSGFRCSPAHMDRGDGVGERDYVYVGRYHCNSDTIKSETSKKPWYTWRSICRNSIHNLGSNIWQFDYAMMFTLWLLYLVEYADWNSQVKIGYGCGKTDITNAGYTDAMSYHTGTNQLTRDTYGFGTQYRHIEGLWDNVYDWVDGCYYNSNGLYVILNPANFSDNTGGILVGLPFSNGVPSSFSVTDVTGAFPLFFPTSSSGGSTSTYSCDTWITDLNKPCLYTGGNYLQNLNHGMFHMSSQSDTYATSTNGARLMVLPPNRLTSS